MAQLKFQQLDRLRFFFCFVLRLRLPAVQRSGDAGTVLQQRLCCRGIHLVTLQRRPAGANSDDRQGVASHPPGIPSVPAIQQAKAEEKRSVQMARHGRRRRRPDGGRQQFAGRRPPLRYAARAPDVPSQARPR